MKKKALSLILMIAVIFSILSTAQADFNQTYYNVRFTGSFAVYTGPGTNYLRANGNAMYGGGVARYYGTASNGWLFMGYETSGGLWRMGYVQPSAASAITTSPSDYSIFNINFTNTAAQITYDTYITDDPLYGNKTPLANLPVGQLVTVLGSWNDYWTYTEVQVSGKQPIRGFVKSDALSTWTGPTPVPTSAPTPVPTSAPTSAPTSVPATTAPPFTGTPYLSGLTHNAPNTGIMMPGTFSPAQTSYLLTVADWVSNIYFVPYCSTPGVTIYFNGQVVQSGARTPTVTLSDKPTFASLTLVGTYGKTNTYTVYIQRRPSERETRVSAGYIDSMYSNGTKNYIRADRVLVTNTPGTNLSTFENQYTTIFSNVCSDDCIFYYGTIYNMIRATSFNDFVANYQNYASTLYRFVILEDEIVAVMPYASDYAMP